MVEVMPRIVCRYSCGAASAVATKLTLGKYGHDRVWITYSDPGSEHEDNKRFLSDCEVWFEQKVTVLRSEKYADTWAVWEGERFIKGKTGAPCTGLLKRAPTYPVSRPDDVLVFGYTKEERKRADRFREQNFEQSVEFPLIDAGLSKEDCLAMVQRAGIALPVMYGMGYGHNNCIGCCKGGMGYWNKIRKDFPEVFDRMAALQRKLGKNTYFWREKDGTPIPLDDLAPDRGRIEDEPNIECSVSCHEAEDQIELDQICE